MKVVLWISIFLLANLSQLNCSRGNVAEEYAPKTDDERARLAMDQKDWDTAIELYSKLITDEPTVYSRYSLLGAAYARKAGINLVNLVQGGGSETGGVFNSLDGFVPESPTSTDLTNVQNALTILNVVPAAERATEDYGSSVTVQISIYSTAYATMFVKTFVVYDADGELDRRVLREMGEEDAESIIAALEAAVEADPDSSLANSINTALEDIDDQPGSSVSARLENYIIEQEQEKEEEEEN